MTLRCGGSARTLVETLHGSDCVRETANLDPTSRREVIPSSGCLRENGRENLLFGNVREEEWGSGARKKMADEATVKGQGRRVRYVFRVKEMRNPC